MPTNLFNNPYHNLSSLPTQPPSSVVGEAVLFNAYNETGGLHTGYNFVDFGNKLKQAQMSHNMHINAPYVDPLQYEDMNPANIPPQLMPRYYKERPNFSYLNNPPPVNPNYDMSSQRTTIPGGYLTVSEGYPTVSPVMVGLYNSRLTLGTASFN
jgi:hypothetical protein